MTMLFSAIFFVDYSIEDDYDFKQWMENQNLLHENIRRVCDKYGEGVKKEMNKGYELEKIY